jgi:polar amino acid transport system substrate-binding protein
MSFQQITLLALLLVTSAVAQGLTMAAEEDYYPYSAEVEGELTGLIPELTRAAFAAVDVNVDFIIRPYSRVLLLVQDGKAVGGFTGSIDDSNESTFYWHSTPLAIVRLVIWGRKGEGETDRNLTAADMEGETVSITRGFFYTDAIDYNDLVKKSVAPSDVSSLNMLALGRSDYALVTELIGGKIVQSSEAPDLQNQIEIVGLIAEVPLHAFFSREHPKGKESAELFQKGLETIQANGEYQRILDSWL